MYLGAILEFFLIPGATLMYLDQGADMFAEHVAITSADECAALIICDRIQPGSKAGFTLKLLDGFESSVQSFLYGIFCILGIAQPVPAAFKQCVFVPLEQYGAAMRSGAMRVIEVPGRRVVTRIICEVFVI